MTEAASQPPPSQQTELELKNEFQSIYEYALSVKPLLERQSKGVPLTDAEQALIDGYPAKAARGVEITRILRRTNTGPAKVKSTSSRAPGKKAKIEAAVDKLMEDIE